MCDHRQRKITLRVIALACWRAERDMGRFPRRVIRLHVKELRAELYVLAHPRRPPTS